MTDHSPRVLIVRLGSLGDVIHAIPAAAALRRRHPNAQIDWLVDPVYVPLLAMVKAVDRPIPLDPRRARRALLSTVARLRRERYDAAVDLQGLLKSAVLARAAGARRTIGMPRAHLREPGARMLYTETADPGAAAHVIEKNLAVMAALGVTERAIEFPLELWPSAVADATVRQFGADGYVLINPGAAWPNKRWPPVRFAALAEAIRNRVGLRSLVVFGPGEREIGEAIVAESNGAATLAPPTAITDLFALARRARLLVSGDTGPLHIGGAVGTPIVALFGPTSAERNGPWSSSDISISRLADCECHYERRCRLDAPCIEGIAVDEVVGAVEQQLTRLRA